MFSPHQPPFQAAIRSINHLTTGGSTSLDRSFFDRCRQTDIPFGGGGNSPSRPFRRQGGVSLGPSQAKSVETQFVHIGTMVYGFINRVWSSIQTNGTLRLHKSAQVIITVHPLTLVDSDARSAVDINPTKERNVCQGCVLIPLTTGGNFDRCRQKEVTRWT